MFLVNPFPEPFQSFFTWVIALAVFLIFSINLLNLHTSDTSTASRAVEFIFRVNSRTSYLVLLAVYFALSLPYAFSIYFLLSETYWIWLIVDHHRH